MTRTPVSDIRHCHRHDRRTRHEMLRSIVWILVSAYITVGAYLDGIRGALVTVAAIGWFGLVLWRQEHR